MNIKQSIDVLLSGPTPEGRCIFGRCSRAWPIRPCHRVPACPFRENLLIKLWILRLQSYLVAVLSSSSRKKQSSSRKNTLYDVVLCNLNRLFKKQLIVWRPNDANLIKNINHKTQLRKDLKLTKFAIVVLGSLSKILEFSVYTHAWVLYGKYA